MVVCMRASGYGGVYEGQGYGGVYEGQGVWWCV